MIGLTGCLHFRRGDLRRNVIWSGGIAEGIERSINELSSGRDHFSVGGNVVVAASVA